MINLYVSVTVWKNGFRQKVNDTKQRIAYNDIIAKCHISFLLK